MAKPISIFDFVLIIENLEDELGKTWVIKTSDDYETLESFCEMVNENLPNAYCDIIESSQIENWGDFERRSFAKDIQPILDQRQAA